MDRVAHILLGLTSSERWAAARRIEPRAVSQEWFVLIGVTIIAVLLVLLIVISYRRRQLTKRQKAETFADDALRRGLSARERQILLAVAVRSGLRHTYDIFYKLDAFDRGAGRLLAECAQTRTPHENEGLKAEVAGVREKLGFRTTSTPQAAVLREHPSSREIPVGKYLELTSRREGQAVAVRAEVVRSDEIELALALRAPLESNAGEAWLARYYSGMCAWEFHTSTVSCNGKKLILNHSDEIRFINRRRFPRVSVRTPALVAHFPFAQTEATVGEAAATTGWTPTFIASTLTELAGPGLRIETPLQMHVDDQILVVVRLAEGTGGAAPREHTLAALGRVRHGRDIERGTGIPDAVDCVFDGSLRRDFGALAPHCLSIAVELIGLSDAQVDELASLTDELSGQGPEAHDGRASGPEEMPAPVTAAAE